LPTYKRDEKVGPTPKCQQRVELPGKKKIFGTIEAGIESKPS
jgi:hypothetical protein